MIGLQELALNTRQSEEKDVLTNGSFRWRLPLWHLLTFLLLLSRPAWANEPTPTQIGHFKQLLRDGISIASIQELRCYDIPFDKHALRELRYAERADKRAKLNAEIALDQLLAAQNQRQLGNTRSPFVKDVLELDASRTQRKALVEDAMTKEARQEFKDGSPAIQCAIQHVARRQHLEAIQNTAFSKPDEFKALVHQYHQEYRARMKADARAVFKLAHSTLGTVDFASPSETVRLDVEKLGRELRAFHSRYILEIRDDIDTDILGAPRAIGEHVLAMFAAWQGLEGKSRRVADEQSMLTLAQQEYAQRPSEVRRFAVDSAQKSHDEAVRQWKLHFEQRSRHRILASKLLSVAGLD